MGGPFKWNMGESTINMELSDGHDEKEAMKIGGTYHIFLAHVSGRCF